MEHAREPRMRQLLQPREILTGTHKVAYEQKQAKSVIEFGDLQDLFTSRLLLLKFCLFFSRFSFAFLPETFPS